MADFFYLPYLLKRETQSIDLLTDDIRVLLVVSGHTSVDTDEFLGDFATLAESDGTGYTPGPGGTGRKILASKSWVLDVASKQARFTFADPVWAAIGADAGPSIAMILYKHNSDSDDTLNEAIVHLDQGGFPVTFTGVDFTLGIPADGLFQSSQG